MRLWMSLAIGVLMSAPGLTSRSILPVHVCVVCLRAGAEPSNMPLPWTEPSKLWVSMRTLACLICSSKKTLMGSVRCT